MNVNVGGTWRQVLVQGLWAKASGTWREVQQGWVNVAGTWRQFYQDAQLLATITVTVGNAGLMWGYNRNSDSNINFGNASGGVTFNDAGAVSRTVTAVFDGTDVGTPSESLTLSLDGVSIPDTDAVFKFIKVNGVTYQRSARDIYTADTGAANDTRWRWNNGATSEFGTTGGANITVEIWG